MGIVVCTKLQDTGTIGGRLIELLVEPEPGIVGLFLSRLLVAAICRLVVEFLSRLFVTIR